MQLLQVYLEVVTRCSIYNCILRPVVDFNAFDVSNRSVRNKYVCGYNLMNGSTNLLFGQNLPKTAWKWRKLDQGGVQNFTRYICHWNRKGYERADQKTDWGTLQVFSRFLVVSLFLRKMFEMGIVNHRFIVYDKIGPMGTEHERVYCWTTW